MENDHKNTLGLLSEKTLKGAGYGYLVGDAALFASGMMSGRHKEAASGLLWAGSGAILARYGNPDTDKKLEQIYKQLGAYLEAQNVSLPEGEINSAMLNKKSGIIENIEAFFYRHPSEAANALYAIGGVTLVQSGMKHKKYWDLASGALVTAGGLAGLLIKEQKSPKPKTEEEAPHGLWEWIKEKPLRLTAGLYAANNFTLAVSAYQERQANPASHSYKFKFLTAASYLFANGLLAMSSKENQSAANMKEKRIILNEVENAAAQVIAAQPKPVREALLQQIAAHISTQPGINTTAAEIVVGLHHQLDVLAPEHNTKVYTSMQPSLAESSPFLI